MPESYGLPGDAAVNYGALGFPPWVDDLCREWGIDSSTYPHHQQGDRRDIGAAPNPQNLNRGIDWAGDPDTLLRFAKWLVSVAPPRTGGVYGPPGVEMVIYQHPTTGERVWYPSWVDYSSDFSGHRDHVHTRFSAPPVEPAHTKVTLTVPLVERGGGRWGSPSPAWNHLIERESSGVPDIIQQIIDVNSGGNEAEGLFQITPATWRGHGGEEFAPSARHATPQQQALVAARILVGNPSGSDWGAGLPGREDPHELMAGLVPVGPTPQEDDFMSALTPDEQREVLDLLRQQSGYRRVSRSPLRKPYEAATETISGFEWNTDGSVHVLLVFLLACILGDPNEIARLHDVATTNEPGREHDRLLAQAMLNFITKTSSPGGVMVPQAVPTGAVIAEPVQPAPPPNALPPVTQSAPVSAPSGAVPVQLPVPVAGTSSEGIRSAMNELGAELQNVLGMIAAATNELRS